MAEDFSNRIGSRAITIGRGVAPTSQDIANLHERQRQQEKNSQPKPGKPFSAYLDQPQGGGARQQEQPEDPPPQADGEARGERQGAPVQRPHHAGKRIIRG